MSAWESALGKTDEWYTPAYIFDALGEVFDLDVANAVMDGANVPARSFISSDSLSRDWFGFVWMNPPFGGRNGLVPWLDKFFDHGNGIALTPDRSSAPWWQDSVMRCSSLLMISGKVKFIRPDGTEGKSPSTGTTLWAAGSRADEALRTAYHSGLGAHLKTTD